MSHKIQKIGMLFGMIIIILFTGCQSKGLVSYQKAMETTSHIEVGEVNVEVELLNTFNKTGLTFEEEKALSDFEHITTQVNTKYDMRTDPKMETNIYYIFGGIGIDASLFLKEEELILQLPIINMYMLLNQENMESLDNSLDENVSKEESALSSALDIDLDKVLQSWFSVFEEENVVVGNNTYILTNEGQIKTTRYDFHLNEDQLDTLLTALIKEVDTETLNKLIRQQVSGFSQDEIYIDVESFISMIQLESLEGEAFVDFDERLIKQNFILKGRGTKYSPGELESFTINLTMTYANLGEDQSFDFPVLTEKNTITQEKLNEIFEIIGQ